MSRPLQTGYDRCLVPAGRFVYPESGPLPSFFMSHKHIAQLLRTIFQDPISGNIHWRDVESLLHHLGAEVDQHTGARMRVVLNGVEGILHRPHHSNVLNRQDVKNLREYLARARATPSMYEAEGKQP